MSTTTTAIAEIKGYSTAKIEKILAKAKILGLNNPEDLLNNGPGHASSHERAWMIFDQATAQVNDDEYEDECAPQCMS